LRDSREAKPVSCDPAGCKPYTILLTEWSPGGDELTPTQKLRQKAIAAKCAAEIDANLCGRLAVAASL
jgi:hypothetical protein